MKVAKQTTVFFEMAADGKYAEVLTLDGVSLVADSGNSYLIMGSRIGIDGVNYSMTASSVQIGTSKDGATVVTSIIVAKR